MELTLAMFKGEMTEALKAYDRHIVCIEKTPDECAESMASLMQKAIDAFVTRGPGLRHGIALDRHITIILSQTESDRPVCGIYFNLHSPHRKKAKTAGAKR